jgi:hypothetical protein
MPRGYIRDIRVRWALKTARPFFWNEKGSNATPSNCDDATSVESRLNSNPTSQSLRPQTAQIVPNHLKTDTLYGIVLPISISLSPTPGQTREGTSCLASKPCERKGLGSPPSARRLKSVHFYSSNDLDASTQTTNHMVIDLAGFSAGVVAFANRCEPPQ